MPIRNDPDSQCREPRLGNPLGVAQQKIQQERLTALEKHWAATGQSLVPDEPLRNNPDSPSRDLSGWGESKLKQYLPSLMMGLDQDEPRCMPLSMFPEIETMGLREAVSDLARRVEELERRLDARNPQSRSDLLETLADNPEAMAIREGMIVNRKA